MKEYLLVKVTAHVGVSRVARERVRKNYGDFYGWLLTLLQHARMLFHTRNLLVSESAARALTVLRLHSPARTLVFDSVSGAGLTLVAAGRLLGLAAVAGLVGLGGRSLVIGFQ